VTASYRLDCFLSKINVYVKKKYPCDSPLILHKSQGIRSSIVQENITLHLDGPPNNTANSLTLYSIGTPSDVSVAVELNTTWQFEHLLIMSKCSISCNVYKTIQICHFQNHSYFAMTFSLTILPFQQIFSLWISLNIAYRVKSKLIDSQDNFCSPRKILFCRDIITTNDGKLFDIPFHILAFIFK